MANILFINIKLVTWHSDRADALTYRVGCKVSVDEVWNESSLNLSHASWLGHSLAVQDQNDGRLMCTPLRLGLTPLRLRSTYS